VKVVLYGNERRSWCTEVDLHAALETLGHQVTHVQEDEHTWGALRDICRRVEPDLFLWVRTWRQDFEGGHWFLEWCREQSIPTVSFHLDLYIGLDREAGIAGDPFWATDHVFTADGGHDEWFAAHGIRHHWLPPAVNAASCALARPDGRYRHDLLWVGSWQRYHAEYPFRLSMVLHLRRAYRARLGVYPRGRQPLRLDELSVAIRSAKVVVGDSLCLPDAERYWSDRICETLGRGGLIVFPRVPGLEQCYTDGEHFLGYEPRDMHDLVRALEEALALSDAERERIALAGREHTLAHHTYEHRMTEMLGVLAERGAIPAQVLA
jgi:hypothetical protein